MDRILSLLLCQELGGKATPLARIKDAGLLKTAGAIAIRQQRATTRRLERESPHLAPVSRASEQILKGLLGSSRPKSR